MEDVPYNINNVVLLDRTMCVGRSNEFTYHL